MHTITFHFNYLTYDCHSQRMPTGYMQMHPLASFVPPRPASDHQCSLLHQYRQTVALSFTTIVSVFHFYAPPTYLSLPPIPCSCSSCLFTACKSRSSSISIFRLCISWLRLRLSAPPVVSTTGNACYQTTWDSVLGTDQSYPMADLVEVHVTHAAKYLRQIVVGELSPSRRC